MMKKMLLSVGFFVLFSAGFMTFGTQHAAAASWCGVMANPSSPDPSTVSANCLAGQDYTALYGLGNSTTSSDTLKTNFINYINSKSSTGYGFQRIGAQFIKNGLDGRTGTWAQRISQSNVTLAFETFNSCGTSWPNTAFDVSTSSVVYDPACRSAVNSLVIRSNGVIYYAIKADCGNPMGNLTELPPAGWKLSGNTTVNNQSSLTVAASTSGTNVTFRHSVYNAGPGTASFNWKMQYRLNGGSWTDVNAGSSVTTGANQYNPNQYAYVYTVPANSSSSFSYCQRTWYNYASGPGTGASTSAAACVGVTTPPPSQPPIGDYNVICGSITGYAYDPDITTWGISVQVNVDGVKWQNLPANQAGSPSPAGVPGNHKFSYSGTFYNVYTSHYIQVIALGINSKGQPDGINTDLGTIYIPACKSMPVGAFSLSCSGITGYTYDPDRPAWQIAVQVIINGQGTTLIANQYGTTGHGFSSAMSSLNGYNPTVAQNVQVIAYGVDGKGVADGYNGDLGTQTMPACYAATCMSTSPSSAAAILAGTSVSPSAVFRNDGAVSWNDGGRVTARSASTGVSGVYVSPTGPGGTVGIGFGTYNVPATLATQTITMQLVLDNSTVIGTCTVSFNPYTRFTLTPSSGTLSLLPDTENPNSANYASQITVTYVDVPGATGITPQGSFTPTRTISKNGVVFYIVNSTTGVIGNVFYYNDTASPIPAPNKLGDKYCGAITVSIISGWINKNSTVINAAGPPATASGSCDTVTNKPYFRVYGGDINAGGAYKSGATCAAPTGGNLFGQYRPGTGGAGTELAAIAQIKVTGVASAILRTSSPTQPSGLTFANSGAGVSTTPPDMGGSFGGSGYCAPDYYQDEQFSNGDSRKTASTNPAINLNSLPWGQQTVVTPSGGTLKITGNPNLNIRHTLFVDGDVDIASDIGYASIGGTDPSKLPYITIIAKGNIYIEPQVTNIEGLFIAQYRNASSPGYIYTCNGLTTTTVPSNCSNKQLRITGAFIANRILLQRAVGTLRDSPGPNEPASSGNIAEVFQFSPQQYIGQPVFKTKTGQYDSIKGLPPILH